MSYIYSIHFFLLIILASPQKRKKERKKEGKEKWNMLVFLILIGSSN